jgi:hypothetical protein
MKYNLPLNGAIDLDALDGSLPKAGIAEAAGLTHWGDNRCSP